VPDRHEKRSGGPGPLFLLDGMSLAFRAYFALPPDLATATGVVTNAVHGFVSMLANIIRDHEPAGLAVAFDLPGPTFRDELVVAYKAGRAETPPDLPPQFDMIRNVLEALAIPVIGVAGYEADDVLATLATQARDRQCDAVVVTGDRDCFQLVEDPHVRVLYNRRGVSDYSLYDEKGIAERTGVAPAKYPMLAALRGDPSDNLPGVSGVGEKTAAKLLNNYGDLEGIFANLAALTPKLRENLGNGEAQVRANASVIPLVRDVPLDVTVEDLSLGGWALEEVQREFEKLELRTLLRRMSTLLEEGRLGPPRGAGGRDEVAAASRPPGRDEVAAATRPPGRDAGRHGGGGENGLFTGVRADFTVHESAAEVAAALANLSNLSDLAPSPVEACLAVAARWVASPGRSALEGLALVPLDRPECHPPGTSGTGALWIGSGQLDDEEVGRSLGRVLSTVPVVGHQVKELMRSLLESGIDCTTLVMDTAVAAYLIDPSSGDYGLDAVVAGVLGGAARLGDPGAAPGAEPGAVPSAVPGTLRLGNGPLVDPAAAVLDAARTGRLVAPLRERLDTEGLGMLHDDVELPLVRVLARMEVAGIGVDVGELRRTTDELVAEARRLELEIQSLAGHELNVNSTPQVRALLYDELELTPGRKTKTGYSTDAATLELLRGTHPVVDVLLRYREVEKLRSTYGESLLGEVASDGRIHATFRQTVARTGRLSSERPNLHNIPVRSDMGRLFRRAFVPARGFELLVADYDQIELRVLAHLSEDPGLVAAFNAGADVHRAVAAGVYGVAPEEVTHAQRDRAKMVSYGLAYGMEAFGLARRLSTGVDEANEIIDRYFAAFPSVRHYMEETVAEARRLGYTRTALGRKRPLADLGSRNYRVRQAAERAAMNAGIQGLAADIFKTALVRLDRVLEERRLRSRLVLQVHDEVIVEVAPGEVDEVTGLTSSSLTGAATLSVPLVVSMGRGASWAEAKAG